MATPPLFTWIEKTWKNDRRNSGGTVRQKFNINGTLTFDIQLMDQWTNGPMDQRINGLMDQWTNGPMDQWTNEPMRIGQVC